MQAQTPPFPTGRFDLFVVDLPLSWRGYSPKGEGRSPQAHYATQDVPALIHLLQQRLDQFSHRPDLIHPAHDLPYGIGRTSG